MKNKRFIFSYLFVTMLCLVSVCGCTPNTMENPVLEEDIVLEEKQDYLEKEIEESTAVSESNSEQSNRKQSINRNLSDEEQFLLKYEVLEQYFNQKKRPSDKLLNDTTEQLTEEQLLQIVDSMYGEVPQEWYTPSQEELTIEDIEKEVKNKIKEYTLTNEKAKKMYTFYTSAIPMNEGLPKEMQNFKNCFEISVNMKDSKYDYAFTLSAKDGSLMKWKRYPQNYFSKENYSANKEKLDTLSQKENDRLFTEEELKRIAMEYAEKVLLPKEELLPNKILVEIDSNPDSNYRKVTIYKSNIEYTIFVNKEDGEVCGLEVK